MPTVNPGVSTEEPRGSFGFSELASSIGPTATGLAVTVPPTTALTTVLSRIQTNSPVWVGSFVSMTALRNTALATGAAYSCLLNASSFQKWSRSALGDSATDAQVNLLASGMIGASSGAAGSYLYTIRTAESVGMPIKSSWRTMPGVMKSIVAGEVARCSVQAAANVISVKLFEDALGGLLPKAVRDQPGALMQSAVSGASIVAAGVVCSPVTCMFNVIQKTSIKNALLEAPAGCYLVDQVGRISKQVLAQDFKPKSVVAAGYQLYRSVGSSRAFIRASMRGLSVSIAGNIMLIALMRAAHAGYPYIEQGVVAAYAAAAGLGGQLLQSASSGGVALLESHGMFVPAVVSANKGLDDAAVLDAAFSPG